MNKLTPLLFSVSLVACGAESSAEIALAVEWTPCPALTDGTGRGAECASVAVPIDWSEPDGATIDVFVKRIERPGATRQVWMLNGGPGASGADFEALAEPLLDRVEGASLYLLDHRGVGRSARLGCPEEEGENSVGGPGIAPDEWPSCIDALEAQWGTDLQHFSTTQAALDLGNLIAATRDGYEHVHVWGGSYGTYWAQRYLRLFPEQPDSATLAGILPPDPDGRTYDRDFDSVTREYMARCDADPTCAARLGGKAAQRTLALYADLEAGHCPQAAQMGLNPAVLRSLFATWMTWSWYQRALMPAIVHRLSRCDDADMRAMQYLAGRLRADDVERPGDRLRSHVLGLHIFVSELAGSPQNSSEVAEVVAGSIASFGLGPRQAELAADWPAYARDDYFGEYPETSAPLLMIQGELDPATTAENAERVRDRLEGPRNPYVLLPGAGHSWEVPAASAERGCPLELWLQFVADPGSEPHPCAEEVPPIHFSNLGPLAEYYFGTAGLWEGGPSAEEAPRGISFEAPAARLAWW